MTMTSKNILLKVLFKIKICSIVNETIVYTESQSVPINKPKCSGKMK